MLRSSVCTEDYCAPHSSVDITIFSFLYLLFIQSRFASTYLVFDILLYYYLDLIASFGRDLSLCNRDLVSSSPDFFTIP